MSTAGSSSENIGEVAYFERKDKYSLNQFDCPIITSSRMSDVSPKDSEAAEKNIRKSESSGNMKIVINLTLNFN